MRILITALLIAAAMFSFAFAETGDTASAAPALQGVEMYPLEDLKAGMKAKAYTVIRGTKIEEFNVEVLELIPDGGFDGGPMILARFTGDVVDFSDGIAGGYSGSPVYLNGKLVGAVSMAMPFTDTHVGGITPIQQMLKSLPTDEELDYSNNTVLPPTDNSGVDIDDETTKISYIDDLDAARTYNDRMRELGKSDYAAVPATTPVYFSGVSPAVMGKFGADLKDLLGNRMELMEMPMGSAKDKGLLLLEPGDAPGLFLEERTNQPPMLPGDACAIVLAEGDVELYGIGTVTYTDDDNQFLIFGHGMFNEGDTYMPIGKAYITWVYGSIQRAFKAGVRLNTLGVVTQDHSSSCGGSFNLDPDLIPIRMKLKDMDTGDSVTKRFKVVNHRDYTPILISMGLSQASAEVLDRRPSGTLKLSYHIEGIGLKEPLRRTNYFSDDFDVFSNGAYEIMPIADLLANNIYRDVKITKVDILAEITRNRINAAIDEAEIIDGQGTVLKPDEDDEATDAEVDEAIGSEEEDAETPEAESVEEPLIPEDAAAAIASWTGQRRYTRLSQLQQQQPAEEEIPPADQAYIEAIPTGEIPTYKPGDIIRVKVRLQPFREDPVWREFTIQVPDDFVSGSTSLYIHGGGDLMSFSELGGKGRSLFGMGPIIDLEDRDLDSILDQIVSAPLNNELVLTLARPYDYNAEMEAANGDSVSDEEELEPTVDSVYQMEWVIYNSWFLPVNIMTEEDVADAEEMEQSAVNGEDMPADAENEDEAEEEYESKLPF